MLQGLPVTNEIIVCLYDGEYHYGLAALANSLVQSNFRGTINVGYTDHLPPWISQLKPISSYTYHLTEDVTINFDMVKTDMHLAFYKPFFIKKTFDDYPIAKKIYYFDVDIVVNAPWHFFSNWLCDEVCLCLDSSFGFVHHNHPWRKDWKKLGNVNRNFVNLETSYVNSGFIGVTVDNICLIHKWIELTNKLEELGANLKEINQDGHNSYKGDQDLLNAAITVCPEANLSLIGKEGMGFTQPAYLMTHAVGKVKPWKKNYFKHLVVNGHKPSYSEKNFFNHCRAPIALFAKRNYLIKKINLVFAIVLGRYIGY